MSYFKKANRVLKRLIQSGKKDFVIFPFGERGMQIKQILNQRYGITERYVVDNGLAEESDNPDILSLKALTRRAFIISFAVSYWRSWTGSRSWMCSPLPCIMIRMPIWTADFSKI